MNDMRKLINIVESAQRPETPITEWAPVLMNLAWETAPRLMMENPMALFRPGAPGDQAIDKVKGVAGKAVDDAGNWWNNKVDQATDWATDKVMQNVDINDVIDKVDLSKVDLSKINIPQDQINKIAAGQLDNLDFDGIYNSLSPEQQADLVSKATGTASKVVMNNPGAVWKGLPMGAKAGLIGGGALAAYGLYNALRRRKDRD